MIPPASTCTVSVPNAILVSVSPSCIKLSANIDSMFVMSVASSPTILPFAVISPDTVRADNVPTDVMFVCAAVPNVPIIELPVIVPLELMLPEAVT